MAGRRVAGLGARIACAVGIIAVLASCSSDDSGLSTTSESGTAGVDTTAAPETSAATENSVESPDPEVSDDVSGDWLVVREVATDNGVFDADFGALAREWNITCLEPDCAEVEVRSTVLGLEPEASPVTASFDGTHLTMEVEEMLACFDPEAGDYTGPEVTESFQTIELDVTARDGRGDIVSMAGTESSGESTPASAAADCQTGETSETSDMVMFRPELTVGADPPEGVVRGGQSLTSIEGDQLGPDAAQPGDKGTFEYRLLPCDDSTCDFIVRQRLTNGGLVEIPVTSDANGGYAGTTERSGDCASDTSGEIILEEVFITTVSLTLKAYSVEGGEVVSISLIEDFLPTAEAIAADADNCYAATTTSEFLGRLVPDPQDDFEPAGPAADGPPEISTEGEILFRETVSGFVTNTVREYGEEGLDLFAIRDALVTTYPTLGLGGNFDEANPTLVSYFSTNVVSDKDLASAENPYMVAVATTDTTGACLGVVIYGFPTLDETFTVDEFDGECTPDSIATAFREQL